MIDANIATKARIPSKGMVNLLLLRLKKRNKFVVANEEREELRDATNRK
jgi:hypothetical protein